MYLPSLRTLRYAASITALVCISAISGIRYRKTAASVAHHRVKFMQALNCRYAARHKESPSPCTVRGCLLHLWAGTHAAVDRGNESSPVCPPLPYRLPLKSSLLHGQKLIQRTFSLWSTVLETIISRISRNSVFREEHMLCTAKANTFGTEFHSLSPHLQACQHSCELSACGVRQPMPLP